VRARPLSLLLATLGCGCASASVPEPRSVDDASPRRERRAGSAPAVRAEVGALDEAAVKRTFREALPDIERCLASARTRLPFFEGELEVFLRVTGDGGVRWAYPRRSSFGDEATERCVLAALGARRWPRPEGGDEGETTQHFAVESEERPAVRWTAADLGPAGSELADRLARCKAASGTRRLEVTVHVDADGRALAAGAAVGDERGREAIGCAVEAATAQRYPSPGSYPAKVTVRAE
jgi:hypothetical protein